MYHLDLPRRYLQAGRFVFVPGNPYWGQPQLAEMLYTWAMALHGPSTAAVLGWCFGLVALLGIMGGVVRSLDDLGAPATIASSAAWVTGAALLAGYSFRGMWGWAYTDHLAALYGLAALLGLLAALRGPSERWLLWTGVFLGFALGVKLAAGALVLAMLPILAAWAWRSAPRRRLVLGWGLLALAVCLPWLLKNALATGNPVYPYLWPTAWVDTQRFAYFSYLDPQDSPPLWQDLLLPLMMTWRGVEGAAGFATDVGPLLLLLIVPGLLSYRGERMVRALTALLVTAWAVMAVAGRYSPLLQQTRLYFALLPAMALAAGWGWQSLQSIVASGIRLRRVVGGLVLLVLGLSLWHDAVLQARLNPASVLLGVRTSEQYLDDSLGWHRPTMRALDTLAPGARVLLLWEPRGLYVPPAGQPDVWIDRWYLDRRTLHTPQAILRGWRDQGFTHLLLNRLGADFELQSRRTLTTTDRQALDELLASLPSPTRFGEVYELYALTP